MSGEIVPRESGEVEIVGPGASRAGVYEAVEFDNRFDMSPLLPTAGTLVLDEKQREVLRAPVDPAMVEIRPDGLIYLPWVEYHRRLDTAFGAAWSMVPNGMPKFDRTSNQIMWGFYLIVRGTLVDFAIGGQQYMPDNDTMSYSDAIEGAKSNALMRVCKRLGIGLELWTPSFVQDWKRSHGETYQDARGKTRWRKKRGSFSAPAANRPAPESKPEPKPEPAEAPQPEPKAETPDVREVRADVNKKDGDYVKVFDNIVIHEITPKKAKNGREFLTCVNIEGKDKTYIYAFDKKVFDFLYGAQMNGNKMRMEVIERDGGRDNPVLVFLSGVLK